MGRYLHGGVNITGFQLLDFDSPAVKKFKDIWEHLDLATYPGASDKKLTVSISVVSLKGKLPQKLQSKSTLSVEIVQIHSLFRHGFIKKPKSKLNRNRRIFFLCDGFQKTDLGIELIANAFRGSVQNTRLFSIFSSHIFYSIIYLFKKRKGAYSCLPSKDTLNYSSSLFKGWFHLWSFYSVENASWSFTCT